MALLTSDRAAGFKPVPTPVSGLVSEILYEYLTTTVLAASDIIDLGPLPAGLTPLDVTLISDDLDTGGSPAITLSVGILNAGKTDLGSGTYDTFISASTVGQAGGLVRATTVNTYFSASSTSERRLGIKVVTGPATGAAAGKKIAVLLKVQS